jgi:hypothetical protein
MCMFSAPKVPTLPPPAQFQQMQQPKDLQQMGDPAQAARRRRGLFSSIFTSPNGTSGPPRVTGTSGGVTGG